MLICKTNLNTGISLVILSGVTCIQLAIFVVNKYECLNFPC